MADESEDRRVSAEAHDRVKSERDAFKAQLDQASAALQEANTRFRVQDYLTEKGISDSVTFAPFAMAQVAGVDDEEFGPRLDKYIKTHGLLERGVKPVDDEETAPPPPAPTPSVATPNPVASGMPATPQTTSYMEWQRSNPTATFEDFKRTQKAGDLSFHPLTKT